MSNEIVNTRQNRLDLFPAAGCPLPAARSRVVAYAHRNCAASKERSVNQTPPSPPAYPDDAPEPDARDTEHAAHLAELPQRWEQVGGATYRRQLLDLIVNL